MNSLFSIGQVCKLFNLSKKALRYYEQKGLLNPAYINKENGYRYYSRNQFINIDLIKCFKKSGISTEEMKYLIYTDNDINSIQDIINNQHEKLEEKIQEILEVKKYISYINNSLLDISSYEKEKVFFKYNPKRKVISYIKDIEDEKDREEYFRKVICDIENKYNDVYPILGGKVTYDKAKQMDYKYDYVMYFPREEEYKLKEYHCYEKIHIKEEILVEGDYLTIVFDCNWSQIDNQYEKIINYIEENNIKILGQFNEKWIMPRIDSNKDMKILGFLEILCMKNI